MGEKEGPMCPVCGIYALSFLPRIESDGEITIRIFCDLCDYEGFVIKTGLKQKDLKKFSKPLKEPITKEMKIEFE